MPFSSAQVHPNILLLPDLEKEQWPETHLRPQRLPLFQKTLQVLDVQSKQYHQLLMPGRSQSIKYDDFVATIAVTSRTDVLNHCCYFCTTQDRSLICMGGTPCPLSLLGLKILEGIDTKNEQSLLQQSYHLDKV